MLFRTRTFLLPVVVLFGLFGACGTDTSDGHTGELGDSHELEHQSTDARLERLTESQEFAEARERMLACMSDNGYGDIANSEQILLKDGTVYDPDHGHNALRGGLLVYHADVEQCNEESGLNDLLRRNKLAPPPLDRTRVEQSNKHTLLEAECLRGKGWEISEPINWQGVLYITIDGLDDERTAALQADRQACDTSLHLFEYAE